MIFGCDVSYCQKSTLVNWADPRIAFGIVKASEGVSQDTHVLDHTISIRNARKKLGLYHFFRIDVEPRGQFECFDTVANRVSYGKPVDIVPAIDIEYYHGHEVTKSWTSPVKSFADMLEEAFGAKPLLYCSQATWLCLGSPDWFKDYPLWVPLYVRDGLPMPAALSSKHVPQGRADWCIWQRYVGPLFGTIQQSKASNAVDQNWAQRLPLIGD